MIMGDTKYAGDDRRKEIARLKAEADALQKQEDADVRAAHTVIVANVTKGMTYKEMCDFRDVLNDRIRQQYVEDSDE